MFWHSSVCTPKNKRLKCTLGNLDVVYLWGLVATLCSLFVYSGARPLFLFLWVVFCWTALFLQPAAIFHTAIDLQPARLVSLYFCLSDILSFLLFCFFPLLKVIFLLVFLLNKFFLLSFLWILNLRVRTNLNSTIWPWTLLRLYRMARSNLLDPSFSSRACFWVGMINCWNRSPWTIIRFCNRFPTSRPWSLVSVPLK